MSDLYEKIDNYLVRYLAYFNYKNYVNRLFLQGDEKVLEIGCGEGNLSRFLIKKLSRGKLTCIDSSRYWIDKARNRLRDFENIEFKIKNILDFKQENYFDKVVVHYVLHDINQKEDLINILRKSLRKGGEAYIREPLRKNHGIVSEDIKSLMLEKGFLEEKSKESYSFPLRGKVYEGVFKK